MAKKKPRKPASKPAPKLPTKKPRRQNPNPQSANPDPQSSSSAQIIPKGLWAKWSGRQHKILDEQAQRYGIPLGEAEIDLAAVAVWIHDLLAAHGRRILAAQDGSAAEEIWEHENEPASPALERKREVDYQLRLRDLLERDRVLVSKDKIRQGLAAGAGIFKQFGDTLQRQHGADALDLWNDTLADWERAIEQLFGDQQPSDSGGSDAV